MYPVSRIPSVRASTACVGGSISSSTAEGVRGTAAIQPSSSRYGIKAESKSDGVLSSSEQENGPLRRGEEGVPPLLFFFFIFKFAKDIRVDPRPAPINLESKPAALPVMAIVIFEIPCNMAYKR